MVTKPKTTVTITTYEKIDRKLIPVLTHSFHGKTEKEARNVMKAHRKTDKYFDASFSGEFKGMKLVNSDAVVETQND